MVVVGFVCGFGVFCAWIFSTILCGFGGGCGFGIGGFANTFASLALKIGETVVIAVAFVPFVGREGFEFAADGEPKQGCASQQDEQDREYRAGRSFCKQHDQVIHKRIKVLQMVWLAHRHSWTLSMVRG